MSKETKVRQMIALCLGVEEDKITQDADFINDLGADSLDSVELIMAFEEELNVEIPDDEAENLTSLAKVMEYLAKVA